jgi:hypothetical protein
MLNVDSTFDSQLLCRGIGWGTAIADVELLLQEATDREERRSLELALDWFQYRLATAAPYPSEINKTF